MLKDVRSVYENIFFNMPIRIEPSLNKQIVRIFKGYYIVAAFVID